MFLHECEVTCYYCSFVPGEGPPAKKEAPKGGPSSEQIAAIKVNDGLLSYILCTVV